MSLFKGFISHLFIFIILVLISSCGGGGDGEEVVDTPAEQLIGNVEVSTDAKENIENYNIAALNFSESIEEMMSDIIELTRNVSGDFSKEISPESLTVSEMERFDTDLIAVTDDMAKALLYSSNLVVLGKSFEASAKKNARNSLYISRDANDFYNYSVDERPLAFAVAGIAVVAYSAYTAVTSAINTRTKPAKKGIELTSEGSEEHQEFNRALGLSVDTPKTETLEQYNSLGLGEKLIKSKEIEAINRDPVFGTFSIQNEVSSSIANSAKELGETAVNTTVGALTTVAGGQLIDKLGQVAGLSQTAAAVIDLGISAVGKQPLDLLSNHLTVTSQSKEKETITIEPPSNNMPVEDAKEILEHVAVGNLNEISEPQDLIDAVNVVAQENILKSVDDQEAIKNADGSITIDVPKKTHLVNIKDPKNNETVKIIDTGESNVVISLDGKVPELINNIDMSKNPNIGVEYVDIEDFTDEIIQVPTVGNFNLLVIASPSNPNPGQSVLVTATVNPIQEGVKILFSVSGTDGYSLVGSPLTGQDGKISFSIIGGAKGVVDTVTVTIEGGISKTFSYTF